MWVSYRIGINTGKKIAPKGKNSVFLYYVAEENNIKFAYDDNNKFLAQSEDHSTLSKLIQELIPGYNYYIAAEKKDETV